MRLALESAMQWAYREHDPIIASEFGHVFYKCNRFLSNAISR